MAVRPEEILANRARRAPARLVLPGLDLLLRGLALVADVDRGRRALKDIELPDYLGELRDHLHGGRTCTYDADTLAFEGHIVVPARGVKGCALKGFHTLDPGQLRRGENAVGENHVLGLHGVAAIRGDDPVLGGIVPLGLLDRGVEQAAVVETEFLGHFLAILENLEATGELHRGVVAHLLEQGQVTVRLDVAGDARIAVPVPGTAHVTAFFAEADIEEPGLAQPVPKQQTRKARTDDQNLAGVIQRLAGHRGRGMHVGKVAAEPTLQGHIVGGTAARLLELPILGLFLGVEDRTGGLLGQRLEVIVLEHRIALAGDVGVRVLGPGVEEFQTGFRVGTNRGSGHGLIFSLH